MQRAAGHCRIFPDFRRLRLGGVKNAALCVLLSSAGMGLLVFTAMYLYFREQSKIMESAILQILDYISGDRDARIECDDE